MHKLLSMVSSRLVFLKSTINLTLLIGLLFGQAFANNLSISNGAVDGNTITVDIAWDNAWNFSEQNGNHDAVWFFCKGKNSSGHWVHIDLKIETFDHFAASPLAVETVNDGKGVFIRLASQGKQNVSLTHISLQATTALSTFHEVRVYGIEMVHIPQGSFYMGDGASISSWTAQDGLPIMVSSEESLDLSMVVISNPNSVFDPTALAGSLSSGFPKGYTPFYVMKYEVSQIQYVDFLNTLSFTQQALRTASSPASSAGIYAMVNSYQPDSLFRNGIAIRESGVSPITPAVYAMDYNGNGVYSDDEDGINRAANYLNWGDLSAYLDWAALRPISEMEFEKICRGANIEPVGGEFAWGTSLATNANHPTNDGTVFEAVSDIPELGSGLANHGAFIAVDGWGLRGVLRTGFAASESSTRLEAGASYYGVMEMSGNVWEQTVMAGGGGETYDGNCGDGSLDEQGNANQLSWCNPSTAFGVLLKGGGWGSTVSDIGSWRDMAVSDRFYSHLKPSKRLNTVGGRGAR